MNAKGEHSSPTILPGDPSLDVAAAMMKPRFSNVLHRLNNATANALAGVIAAISAACWVVVGVVTDFPTWWQISLYSTTAIVTFVMVFVIQHTQNKQVAAVQRKLDELISSSHRADNSLISVEHAPEIELQQLSDSYRDRRNETVSD